MADRFEKVLTTDTMKELGRKGGASRSEAKRAASRANQKKAVEARRVARLGTQSNG